MKAIINKNGEIKLLPENDLEKYALTKWWETLPNNIDIIFNGEYKRFLHLWNLKGICKEG